MIVMKHMNVHIVHLPSVGLQSGCKLGRNGNSSRVGKRTTPLGFMRGVAKVPLWRRENVGTRATSSRIVFAILSRLNTNLLCVGDWWNVCLVHPILELCVAHILQV